jgi:1,2-diacylglycerol 3-alpha-glucosyltransferase
MRIGIITNSYPPNLNGVSLAVYNLQKALESKGIPVFIATPKIPGVVYASNIFPIPSAPAPSYTSKDLRMPLGFGKKLFKFFQDNDVDILHSQDTFVGGIDTVFLAQKLQIPCVHTYHTLVEEYEYFKLPGYKQFIRSYSQIICDSHNGVVALSDKIRQYLIDIQVSTTLKTLPNIYCLPEPNPDYNPEVITNFIEQNRLQKTFNILTFGRIAKEKNLLRGIEILRPMLKKFSDIRYIIAGDGPYYKQLELEVENMNLSNQIVFFGRYTQSDIKFLCENCQFFYSTSYSEVLPTTPLEAMSYNLPVVAVNDLAYNYLVRDGYNGFWQNEDDLLISILDLYQNKSLLKQLQIQAKQTYLDYTKHDYTQDYIDYYQEIINSFTQVTFVRNLVIKNLKKLQASSYLEKFAERFGVKTLS